MTEHGFVIQKAAISLILQYEASTDEATGSAKSNFTSLFVKQNQCLYLQYRRTKMETFVS